jgi:IclR family transcriptional regulator, KDG regulon repressor
MNPVDISSTEGFFNKSLERALKILTVYSLDKQAFTLVQLSKVLGLSKATVLRLCTTLLKYDFLSFDDQTRQYSLGLKLFELGALVFASFSLRRIAAPHLETLQARTGKTLFLGILKDGELVYIDKKDEPTNYLKFGPYVGQRRPPYFGMLGQTLLAYLSEGELEEILKNHPLQAITSKSITDINRFKERLAAIRSQGYFLDEGEAFDGIAGVGAPIRDFNGRVVAAVGVGFLLRSETGKSLKRIIGETLKTASAISAGIGYSEAGAPRGLQSFSQ